MSEDLMDGQLRPRAAPTGAAVAAAETRRGDAIHGTAQGVSHLHRPAESRGI
jgi:hypothetical protein